ncbi:MAG: membrane protein insertase YidC [Deltaproteobacteria bacterium]|nr:membrane protein insertase YidC [Deltaproteobacteria bacterium]
MEKNTLIAIVLSMAVLLAWSFLFEPEKAETPKQVVEQGEQPSATPPPSSAPQAQAPVAESGSVTPPATVSGRVPRIIEVDHPLYVAKFTEQRATIESFKLRLFTETVDTNSPMLELCKSKDPVITLGFLNKTVPDISFALFAADQSNVDLTSKGGPQTLTFNWTSANGVQIIKRYTFHPDSYLIDMDVTLRNLSGGLLDENMEVQLNGAPFEAVPGYYNNPGILTLINNEVDAEEVSSIEKQEILSGEIHWVSYHDNYFMMAVVPDGAVRGSVRMNPAEGNQIRVDLVTPPVKLPNNMETLYGYHLYFGPRQLETLKALNLGLERAVDYGFFDIIAKPILFLLKWLHKGLKNYGLAIIIVTIFIKILFWPLTQKSYNSMKGMKALQPHINKLREEYKDDKQRLNSEMMALYKSNKVNPMGGCLPMLIQIPVFFALYRILGQSIEMRHAPFMLWINDLSAPDRLPVGFHIPYTGGLPILTLLMGLSMFIQQKMTPTPGDPTQAKMMMLLPVFFTFLFINFPSGLVLYWLVNNILSIGQQYYVNRKA